MSQFDWGVIDPNSKSGPQLALDLNKFRDAVNSSHKGGTRPAYITAGMLWVREVSSSQWDLVLFDGDTDFVIRSINPSNNTVLPIPSTLISGLGTAAAATLTTSTVDGTAGRVLKVGDFGIASNLSVAITDANLATAGGFYSLDQVGGVYVNGPTQIAAVKWTIMYVPARHTDRGFQIASPETGDASDKNRLFTRQVFAGTWSPWVEFFTSGNIPALISDPGMQAELSKLSLTYAGAPVALSGKQSVVFAGIPSWAKRVTISVWDANGSANGASSTRAGANAIPVTAGYNGQLAGMFASTLQAAVSPSDELWLNLNNTILLGNGTITYTKSIGSAGTAIWNVESIFASNTAVSLFIAKGRASVVGDLSQVELKRVTAGQTFVSGFANVSWE